MDIGNRQYTFGFEEIDLMELIHLKRFYILWGQPVPVIHLMLWITILVMMIVTNGNG